MPSMREAYGSEIVDPSDIIAILLADIHLSLNPPVWRSAESDWMLTQCDVLAQVMELRDKYDCPVICVGDIFDRWNACPELINFAIAYLPDGMYAIPGQHDLPLHQIEDIRRSAYWTLVEANKIKNIKPFRHKNFAICLDNFVIYGFPFGENLVELIRPNDDKIHIAAIHDYIWIPGHSYPNAPDERMLKKLHHNPVGGKFYGYDVVVYGDNHKGFMTHAGKTTIFNCGTLMRRKSDEIDYKPQVGLLLKSGEIVPHYLDISEDKYLETMEEEISPELDMTSFMKELEKLGETVLDFKERMEQLFLHTKKISTQAKQIIIEAMEKK